MDQDMDLAIFLEEMESLTKDLVIKEGGYTPFGAIMDQERKVEITPFELKEDVNYERAIEPLFEKLRSSAKLKSTLAVGVAQMANVKNSSGSLSKAIAISMQHRGGRCIEFAMPFARTLLGKVKYDEPQVGIGKLKFF